MSFSASVEILVAESNNDLVSKADWWGRVSLARVAKVINGFPLKSEFFSSQNGVPVIRIRDVTSGKISTFYTGLIPEGYWIAKGDILIGMDGDFNCRIWESERALLNQRVCKIEPNEEKINKQFLFYALPGYLRLINDATHSITVKHLSSKTIGEIPLAYPPLNEQRRIVAKLDRLFARSRCAREELGRVSGLVQRYKQAILAAAFRGDLTADWREHIGSNWTIIPLSQACLSITDGDHQAPPKIEEGIPFITISAINDGKLNLSKATRFVSKSYFESRSPQRKPAKGDILFSVTGSIGIPVLVDTCEPFTFQRHIGILKVNKNLILEKYLLYILGSEQIQKQGLDVATGTAQLTIPLGGLRNFQIPLPVLEEQKEIVRRIEKLFKAIDLIEQEHQRASQLLDRLEQATLSKAFRGELVPQDPNDEPAAILLERIQGEQQAQPKGKAIKSKQSHR